MIPINHNQEPNAGRKKVEEYILEAKKAQGVYRDVAGCSESLRNCSLYWRRLEMKLQE